MGRKENKVTFDYAYENRNYRQQQQQQQQTTSLSHQNQRQRSLPKQPPHISRDILLQAMSPTAVASLYLSQNCAPQETTARVDGIVLAMTGLHPCRDGQYVPTLVHSSAIVESACESMRTEHNPSGTKLG